MKNKAQYISNKILQNINNGCRYSKAGFKCYLHLPDNFTRKCSAEYKQALFGLVGNGVLRLEGGFFRVV